MERAGGREKGKRLTGNLSSMTLTSISNPEGNRGMWALSVHLGLLHSVLFCKEN